MAGLPEFNLVCSINCKSRSTLHCRIRSISHVDSGEDVDAGISPLGCRAQVARPVLTALIGVIQCNKPCQALGRQSPSTKRPKMLAQGPKDERCKNKMAKPVQPPK